MNTVATLLDAPFNELVEDDTMRPEQVSPEMAAELREPENAVRWRLALVRKKLKIQTSLRAANLNLREGMGNRSELLTRRNRTAFALGRVELRLLEAAAGVKARRNRAFDSRTLLDRAHALLLTISPKDPRVLKWIEDREKDAP
jgi:hypothetical protein